MITFLHNYLPQPILFKLGFIEVHWYGLLVVLGIIGALSAVLFLARKQNITSDEVINLGFYAIISGLLGARIYAVFLDLPYYLNNPWEIPAVWHGGLAIHGAIIGGGLAILIYAIKKKQSVWLWRRPSGASAIISIRKFSAGRRVCPGASPLIRLTGRRDLKGLLIFTRRFCMSPG